MIAPRRWQVVLGRYVAPFAAFFALLGLLTLLVAVMMLLMPSVGAARSRPVLLAGCSVCVGGVLTYLWIGWLVSLGRGGGIPQPPCSESLPKTPNVVGTRAPAGRHIDDGLAEPNDADMSGWARLSPPQRRIGP
jgi:hypothetical protein